MSTTNPDPGRPSGDPSAHPHLSPVSPHADDHGASGPPDPSVIARGHEVDTYDPKSVFSVPLLVILFFVLAFGTTTILFYYLAPSVETGDENPQTVDRNKAPLDERLARIERGSKDVDQPRLEPLRLRSGDLRAITRPELPTGNSPEIHPEDLRPSASNSFTHELFRTESTGRTDGAEKVYRVSIEEFMKLDDKNLKDLFKVQPNQSAPQGSTNLPTAANAGRGFGSSSAVPPGSPTGEGKK